jgi:hypothetical protein
VPPASFRGELGQQYFDESVSPPQQYVYNGQTWESGGNAQATETTAGIARLATAAEATTGTDDTTIMTPAKVALVAIAGAPDATEVTKGIAQLATQAEAEAGTNDTDIMTPLKVAQAIASGSGAGNFTTLDASGAVTFASTGAIEMTSDTASFFDVTGAGIDLTLSSDAGRVIVNGEEAAANAITLVSAAGGVDLDAALQVNIASSQNAVDAIRIVASAGGVDIDAVGAAGEDINLTNTGASIVLSATENVADAIVLSAPNGGIDLSAGGAAGEDIDLVNTAGSINLSAGEAVADALNFDAAAGGMDVDVAGQLNMASSQNAADAVVIIASAGGVDITATGTAGEDLDLLASGSSVNVTATENAAQAIYLRSNGGTSETIDVHVDQGTGVASLNLHSDVGGVTIASGLASADAINITASDAASGIDIESGTAGFIVDSTGAVSLDAGLASNFTVSGATEDLTLESDAGRVIVNAGEDAADAIYLHADAGTSETIRLHSDQGTGAASVHLESDVGGITLTSGLASTDALNLVATAGGLDVNAALEINISSSEAAVSDSITIDATAADGGVTISAGTGNVNIVDTDLVLDTGDISTTAGSITSATTLTATLGDITASDGNLVLGTAGNKIESTSVGNAAAAGANSFGTVTLVGGTVTVATTAVTTNSIVYLTRQTVGATGAAALGLISRGTIVNGVSFDINALDPADATALIASDVSVVGWMIVN